jgi:hypothetical protein
MLALRIAGGYFMLRSMMFFFSPGTITSVLNYPPPEETGWNKKAGPSPDEVKLVMMSFAMYSIVNGGIAALALSSARAGDTYTQSLVAVGIGIVSLMISVGGYFGATSLGIEAGPAMYKMLIPTIVCGLGMLFAGVPGALSGKPGGQPIKQSGKVMFGVACFSVLQGLMVVFGLANFGKEGFADGMHESTVKMMGMIMPMWGGVVVCSGLIRMAVVYAGNTESIYQVNRATVLYFAQLGGAMIMSKVLDLLDEKKLNIQMVMLMMYMMVSFFGGTVADDEATKKAAAAKEKVK